MQTSELPEYANRDSFGLVHVQTAAEAIMVSDYVSGEDIVIVDDPKQSDLLNHMLRKVYGR